MDILNRLKGLVTVDEKIVDDILAQSRIVYQHEENQTTIARCVLPNKFVIMATSSCANPISYDAKYGEQACREMIKNDLWKYLAFLMNTVNNGFEGTKKIYPSKFTIKRVIKKIFRDMYGDGVLLIPDSVVMATVEETYETISKSIESGEISFTKDEESNYKALYDIFKITMVGE